MILIVTICRRYHPPDAHDWALALCDAWDRATTRQGVIRALALVPPEARGLLRQATRTRLRAGKMTPLAYDRVIRVASRAGTPTMIRVQL